MFLSHQKIIIKNMFQQPEWKSVDLTESYVSGLFDDYLKYFEKNYDDSEKTERLQIFRDNLEKIREHNNSDSSFEMGINQFADLRPEEMKKFFGLRPSENQN